MEAEIADVVSDQGDAGGDDLDDHHPLLQQALDRAALPDVRVHDPPRATATSSLSRGMNLEVGAGRGS